MIKPGKPRKLKPKAPKALRVLAIDFDGVIHDKANPIEGKRMGAPLPGTKEAMDRLYKKNRLIIHTVMATSPGGIQAVKDWLDYYKIPFHEVTAIKPTAAFYIDDKAVKHIDWSTTLEIIK